MSFILNKLLQNHFRNNSCIFKYKNINPFTNLFNINIPSTSNNFYFCGNKYYSKSIKSNSKEFKNFKESKLKDSTALKDFKEYTESTEFNKLRNSKVKQTDYKSEPTIERKDLRKIINSDAVIKKQVKGSGPGGQHVNKANTCSYIKDEKTGISVKNAQSRDTVVNKGVAKKILLDKLDLHYNKGESKIAKKIEKVRKQKAKQSKKSKDKYNSDKKD